MFFLSQISGFLEICGPWIQAGSTSNNVLNAKPSCYCRCILGYWIMGIWIFLFLIFGLAS